MISVLAVAKSTRPSGARGLLHRFMSGMIYAESQADSDTRKSMLAGPRSEEVGFAHDSPLEEAVSSEPVSERRIPC